MDQRTSLAKARFLEVKEMQQTLTMKETAEYLGCHYQTVYKHRQEWGFFKMKGSKIWRVLKSDLDLHKEKANNPDRLALSVEEEKLCRSTKETKSIGLLSQRQAVRELDALLAQR
ncbi:helix-turn-helix domain-containing protein [Actinobacillus minor]|nr:helix-turn-helix domain-containing protein [Actinobacillus minor]MDY5106923.1 helix-turn-helix domain-containing protein [Actinobacillus minor]